MPAVIPAGRPDLATVLPLRSVLATPDTDGVVAPHRCPRFEPIAGLNPADAMSRMLPH